MSQPIVEVKNLEKTYPGGITAVDKISFNIEEGEFFAILGPSGCGKTTLLRMLAGLEQPSAGQIVIAGQDMKDVPANQRPTNMVFQSYAVFPHMNVVDNISYGLKVTGVPKNEINKRVSEILDLVKLSHLARRRPSEMSGGQKQRVALARALVKRPKVLLLDEPLSALDAKLREEMRSELSRLQREVGISFVFVTHDQSEALSMATRIAVMDRGQVQQIAEPKNLYENPSNRFVAEFIGRINVFDRTDEWELKTAEGMINPNFESFGPEKLDRLRKSKSIGVRPERCQIKGLSALTLDEFSVNATVKSIVYYGQLNQITAQLNSGRTISIDTINVSSRPYDNIFVGDNISVSWSFNDTIFFVS